MDRDLLLQLIALFFITEVIGLAVGYFFIGYFAAVPEQRPGIVSQDPEDIGNSIGLIVWILFTSGLILLAIKFLKGNFLEIFLKILEALAVFGASWIVFSVLLENFFGPAGDTAGFFLAIALVASKNIFKKNLMVRNVASIFSTAGAGAIVGTLFGIVPVIIFIVLLAVYDYIAVFKTKHMVTMAKALVNSNLAFTYALPTKKHKFELGTGDLVIPLAFSVSVLMNNMGVIPHPFVLLPSIAVMLASLLGLVLTIDWVSKRVGTAVPALPLQTAFMIIVFVATKIVFAV